MAVIEGRKSWTGQRVCKAVSRSDDKMMFHQNKATPKSGKWKKHVLLLAALALVIGIFRLNSVPVNAAAAKKIKTVTLAANNRSVTKRNFTIAKGSKAKLKVNVSPKSSMKSIKYKSGNKSVATVSKSGVITAKRKGKAKITVTVRGKNGDKKTTWLKVKVGTNVMNLKIGKQVFTATLVDNSSTRALRELLKKGPLEIHMRDYADMEKVGSIGTSLPRNDKPTSTKAGDLILYQGNQFVIYYDTNSWDFTRLGKINDIKAKELKKALGKGSVTVTLSLD